MQRDVVVSKAGVVIMVLASSLLSGCSSSPDDSKAESPDIVPGTQPTQPTPQPPAPPPPLSAPPGEWAWLDVPESECANGTPTGLGFNIGTSKDLVIFLEGGGACWNESLCIGYSASYIDGYGQGEWEAVRGTTIQGLDHGGIFDRTAANNPYKDSSFVYVPYCTADVHSGDATAQFSTRSMRYSGRKNIEAFLTKIVPSFKEPTRVTLAGRSAGGLGAVLNYWRVKRAFGETRVDLLDDSAPPLEQSTIAPFAEWSAAWNLSGAFPPDCSECQTNIGAVVPFYARTQPSSRFAFLSYDQDSEIQKFYGQSADQVRANLETMTESTLGPLPNAKYFVVTGTQHSMAHRLDRVSEEGKLLGDWLFDFATDSSAWTSVSPL